MNLKTIIAFVFSLFSLSAIAQEIIWSDGFESDETEWLFYDNDGDGRNWIISDINPSNGLHCLFGGYSPTAEDNWAVSPAIALPNDGNMITVEWQVFAHTNYVESYELRVTCGDAEDLEGYDSIFSESVTGGYFAREVDITAYAGRTIRIALRHLSHNQNFICIDEVMIKHHEQLPPQPPIVDIVAPTSAFAGEEVTLTAQCENAERFHWDIEGAAPSNPESRTTKARWVNEGRYRISLTATNAEGSATVDRIISIVSKNETRPVAVEADSPLLYPNPATGIIATGLSSVIEIAIVDAAGRTVASSKGNKTDISRLPDGIYTAKIVTSDGIITKRFVKTAGSR